MLIAKLLLLLMLPRGIWVPIIGIAWSIIWMLLMLPRRHTLSRRRRSSIWTALERVLGLKATLWCGLHGSPRSSTSLIHFVPATSSLRKIPFVRINVHTSESTLVALSIGDSHIGNALAASIQPRPSNLLIFVGKMGRWRNCTWKQDALMRQLRGLGKRDTN